jgi:hypothetical protein
MHSKMSTAASVAVPKMVGAGGSLVLAPAESAAGTHDVTLTCQAPTTIYGDFGDTFIFTMANTCNPSWDTWPNGGKGGFVCNRFVPEYGN